ncbi:MAG TPA: hypothetical protein VGQ91_05405 [Ideonella sp.]|jgi:hypothetical protein|nr:hypothetical protein [Ideonella sp.]
MNGALVAGWAEMAVWAPEEPAPVDPERAYAELDRRGLWLSAVVGAMALLAAAALALMPMF